jgi:hypothetical protein
MVVEHGPLPLGQVKPGKTYPLWLERILMIAFIVSLFVVPEMIRDSLDGAFGLVSAWCLYPFFAVCFIELVGRWIQSFQS